MQENPYQKIVKVMDRRAGGMHRTAYRTGTVLSLSPLTVDVEGTRQSGNILCNAELMAGAMRNVSIKTGETAITAEMTLLSAGINAGDSVLMLSDDDQSFVILCKVV